MDETDGTEKDGESGKGNTADECTGGKAESTGTEEKIYQIIADYLDLKPGSFNGDSSLIGQFVNVEITSAGRNTLRGRRIDT